ncbi:hypothetical protein [Gorillibacterium sp. CAU 1737]|uniref:hypothetical protein n=1 Tax=Gorillibacterium sp. CAU 1737 TaxID=3140362 RepID=UPI003261CDD5
MSQLDDFRNNTGEFAEEPAAELDAAVQEEEPVVEDAETEDVEAPEETAEADEESDEPELSPKEQTAFVKRLDAEKRKLEEKIRAEIKAEYNPYEEVVQTLGGDPAKILENIRQNQLMSQVRTQADQMAEQYGWTDQEYHAFMGQETQRIKLEQQQQQTQREITELRIQVEINKLAKRPEFTGIDGLEKEIIDKVARSNGALSVSEAFLALGGEARINQIKRETEQRMLHDRGKGRTVVKDSAAPANTVKALDPDILQQAQRMGLSEQEARELLKFEAGNIQEYRKKKK